MSSCPFPSSWNEVRATVNDVVGQPGQGVHAARIGPFALVDTLATVIAFAVVWYYFAPKCWGTGRAVLCFLLVLLLTVPIHMAFGVETAGVKLARRMWFDSDSNSPSSRFSSMKRRLFSDSADGSSSDNTDPTPTPRIAGPGQDTDSYPLAADWWRAAPVDETNQDFSDI